MEDTYKGQVDNPLSLNRYTYVSNNPLRFVDPSGHWQKGDELLPKEQQERIGELTKQYQQASWEKDTVKQAVIKENAQQIRQDYYSTLSNPTSAQSEAATLAGYFFGRTVDLGAGWKVRVDSSNESTGVQKHVHVENKKVGHWSQNEDGSVHDEHANSSGEPPGWVKKEVQKKLKWDWDEKRKVYTDKEKSNSSKYAPIDYYNDPIFTPSPPPIVIPIPVPIAVP
jgi:hypothetical protein